MADHGCFSAAADYGVTVTVRNVRGSGDGGVELDTAVEMVNSKLVTRCPGTVTTQTTPQHDLPWRMPRMRGFGRIRSRVPAGAIAHISAQALSGRHSTRLAVNHAGRSQVVSSRWAVPGPDSERWSLPGGDALPAVQLELSLPGAAPPGAEPLAVSITVGGRLQELRGAARGQLSRAAGGGWAGSVGVVGVGGWFSAGGWVALPAPALSGAGAAAATLQWRWGQIEWAGWPASASSRAPAFRRVALATAEGQLLLGGQLRAASVELSAAGTGAISAAAAVRVGAGSPCGCPVNTPRPCLRS